MTVPGSLVTPMLALGLLVGSDGRGAAPGACGGVVSTIQRTAVSDE